jgi:hypothetical protein
MFLSVVRLRVIYSPFYRWVRKPSGPLVVWVYQKLRQPPPLPGPAARADFAGQPPRDSGGAADKLVPK